MPTKPRSETRWWCDSTVYQVYPRSFADSNGDGIGDLEGMRSKLDHLQWLGVDTIWLSPVFTSPMADFGYDVADYCSVDPIFGDLADFDRVLEDVHRRDMRLLLDWVPNHTSALHPWFVDARSSRDSAHRDWYVWRDPAPDGGVPNNWTASLREAPAWTFDTHTDQYYLHLFLSDQPDLNWANPDVEAAMHETLRFWLDRGVDGFRADVVHCIGKSPALLDDPPELVGLPHCVLHDETPTHELLRRIRQVLASYDHDPMIVGEVVLLDPALVATYLGDQLHLAFNFMPMHLPWDAALWQDAIGRTESAHTEAWPTWVLSNHDVPRHRSRFGGGLNAPTSARGTEERARAAAVLLLGMRGTPFLYQGEELGLLDAVVPDSAVQDPGGRDGCRAPIPWTTDPGHGWNSPWLPLPPEADQRNVQSQKEDDDSILHLYRALIALRKHRPVLVHGVVEVQAGVPGVVIVERTLTDDVLVVVVNMSDVAVTVPDVYGTVVVDSVAPSAHDTEFSGTLAPRQAVIISPD